MRQVILVVVVSSVMLISPAAQSKPSSLQGAWRVTEIILTGPNARTIKNPQPGMMLFTAKHYATLMTASDKPRLDLPTSKIDTATADELRAAWNPLTANAGTYEWSGDTLTTKVMIAKNQTLMNNPTFQTYSGKLEGNTATFVQKANQAGPNPNPTTVKLTRLD